MPEKRYKRSRSSKSKGKKSKSVAKGQMVSYSAPLGMRLGRMRPFPERFYTKLVYHEPVLTVNPGVGGTADSYVFRANDLYDPNLTGVGHQPSGFDQIMNQYNNFVVLGSKIKVTAYNDDTTYPSLLAIDAKNTSATTGDMTIPIEGGTCNYTTLGGSGAYRLGSLEYKCNPNKMLGVADPFTEISVWGTASGSPTYTLFYHVIAQPISSSDVTIVRFAATIEYFACFFKPLDPGLS